MNCKYCSISLGCTQNSKTWFLVLKVDISTMLEEAVQYVKFLQLQIKVIARGNPYYTIKNQFTLALDLIFVFLLVLYSFWALMIYGCIHPSLTMEWTLDLIWRSTHRDNSKGVIAINCYLIMGLFVYWNLKSIGGEIFMNDFINLPISLLLWS